MTLHSLKDMLRSLGVQMLRRRLLLALTVLVACELKGPAFFEPPTQSAAQFSGSIVGAVTINGVGTSGITVRSGLSTAVTGAGGTYRMDLILPGTYSVNISGTPANATCTPATGVAIVSAGGEANVSFACTVPTTGSVAGTVTMNGAPASGIVIAVGTRTVTTGADGTYRMDNLTPGANTLVIGGLPFGATCSQPTREVIVTAGVTTTSNFVCTRPTTGSVVGTVMLNGAPAASALITVSTPTGSVLTSTGAAGTYRLDGLAPGQVTVAVGELPPGSTCTPSTQQVTVIAGTDAPANFTCTRPLLGAVIGVVMTNGTPSAGITMVAGGRTATTGASGSYRIDGVAAGAQFVSPQELPPATTCSPSVRSVNVVADGMVTADFTCTRPTTGVVKGRVTLNGNGASGITVNVGMLNTVTATDGNYRLEGVPLGSATVVLSGLSMSVSCSPASRMVSIDIVIEATADFTCTQTGFTLGVMSSYRHLGMTSQVCAQLTTTPAQPNAAYSGMLSGPGVITSAVSGSLSAQGTATLRFGIGSFGMYSGSATVLGQLINFSINVTSSAGTCPP